MSPVSWGLGIPGQLQDEGSLEGVFAEKGALFRGKWGLDAPSPHPQIPRRHPRPLPPPLFVGGFTENPTRGGGGPLASTGNLGVGGGGVEAPFTAKTSPLFGENAF